MLHAEHPLHLHRAAQICDHPVVCVALVDERLLLCQRARPRGVQLLPQTLVLLGQQVIGLQARDRARVKTQDGTKH